jgi:hypothetical protein
MLHIKRLSVTPGQIEQRHEIDDEISEVAKISKVAKRIQINQQHNLQQQHPKLSPQIKQTLKILLNKIRITNHFDQEQNHDTTKPES